jgi:metal-dependent amidase/aminoacylase/carboxypeptidase family protein
MSNAKAKTSTAVLASLGDLLPDLESVYKAIHAHPELSMQETRASRRTVFVPPAMK